MLYLDSLSHFARIVSKMGYGLCGLCVTGSKGYNSSPIIPKHVRTQDQLGGDKCRHSLRSRHSHFSSLFRG